jgi:hypothetical protein
VPLLSQVILQARAYAQALPKPSAPLAIVAAPAISPSAANRSNLGGGLPGLGPASMQLSPKRRGRPCPISVEALSSVLGIRMKTEFFATCLWTCGYQ